VSETPFYELPKEIKRKCNKIMQLNDKITDLFLKKCWQLFKVIANQKVFTLHRR